MSSSHATFENVKFGRLLLGNAKGEVDGEAEHWTDKVGRKDCHFCSNHGTPHFAPLRKPH